MLSLLSLFALALPQTVGAQSYPGGGSGGGYPGGGSGGGYPGGGSGGSSPGGSYGPPAYSGGKTTVTTTSPPSPTQTSITPYGPNATTNAPGDWGGGTFTYINGGGGSGSVTCAGQITTTFTWNPGASNAPAPASGSVIVTETANVAWSGPGSTGDCGLPNPTTPASQPPNLTATHYTTNGGSAISLNCTPSASMSGSSPQPYQTLGGGAYVGYTARVSPVTMNLDGTTPDSSGNLNILVGQGCTASLVGIPTELRPYTTYSWTIPGITFQSWNGDSGSSDVVADTGSGLTNQPTAHWYWNDTAGIRTVTCTATVTPPSGQGSPFTLTLTQQVNLQRPTWTANNHGGLGYIVHPSTFYALQAGPTPLMLNQGFSEGSSWRTTVSTPLLFSTGQFGYASIITPGEYLTPYGGTEGAVSSDNGQEELDGKFPYLGQTYGADGMAHDEGDSPALPFGSAQQPPDFFGYVRLADTFKTYLMFKPGSGDAQWVPLAESDWHLNMGTYRPLTGHWSDYPSNQSTGGVYIDSDFVPQPTHPSWTQVSAQPHG